LKIAARSCRSNAQNLEINLSLTICDMSRAYLAARFHAADFSTHDLEESVAGL
jgi:hypothetical protein